MTTPGHSSMGTFVEESHSTKEAPSASFGHITLSGRI